MKRKKTRKKQQQPKKTAQKIEPQSEPAGAASDDEVKESSQNIQEPADNVDNIESVDQEEKQGKNRAEERRERKKQKEEEQKEIAAILEEEDVQELEDEEKDKLSEIDSLTAVPLTDDVLLFAIPVCAPYSAMSNYKFKVKLTPGNVKRGKAAKTALSVFGHIGTSSVEKDLIKCVPETEITGQLMGAVKISTPGLMSATKQAKQQKKKGAQRE